MSISKKSEQKLSITRKLVESLNLRESKFDDSSFQFCEQSERTEILKSVQSMDETIDERITTARELFNPTFSDYSDGEISFLLYMFSSAFSCEVPRIVSSRDLELICRNDSQAICQILQSIESGELRVHISQTEMTRGNGFEFSIRSITLLCGELLSDLKAVK